MSIFIIEHLEPRLWKWCLVEYKHISSIVGRKNLWFTNITRDSERKKLAPYGKVYAKKVKDMQLKNACVLDPNAKETLSDKDSTFSYIILGGILGDFPPKKRTKKELTQVLGVPARNLGRQQMSTNTAAYVAWKILQGTPLKSIDLRKNLIIATGPGEEVELPFTFAWEGTKPVLPHGYIEMAKKGF